MTGIDREMLRRMVREAVAEALAELRHGAAPAARPGPSDSDTSRLRVVTEAAVAGLPEGSTLRLAPDAVVTPLARDRARARRITLERIR
jgi:hypothetical protein